MGAIDRVVRPKPLRGEAEALERHVERRQVESFELLLIVACIQHKPDLCTCKAIK